MFFPFFSHCKEPKINCLIFSVTNTVREKEAAHLKLYTKRGLDFEAVPAGKLFLVILKLSLLI